MVNFIYKKVEKFSNLRGILTWVFLFLIVIIVINGKPFGVAKLKEYTDGVGILDLEINYTPEQAYKILELQGEVGRQFYVKPIILLDFLLPLTYMMSWSALIIFIFKKWLLKGNVLQILSLTPFLAGLSDYLENILILTMLYYFPSKLYNIASIANIMTILKNLFSMASILLIIIGLVVLLYKRFIKRNRREI